MVQVKDDGLWRYGDHAMHQVPNSHCLDSLDIRGIHEFDNGDSNGYLIITKENGLYFFDGRASNHVASALDSLTVWNTAELAGGKVAIATAANGLGVLDKQKCTLELIDEGKGLYFNSLVSTAVDREEGVWVSSNIGIARVDFPAHLRAVVPTAKAKLMAQAICFHEDKLFVGLVDGGGFVEFGSFGLKFSRLPEMTDLVKTFIPFGDGLLIGSSNAGIFFWKEGRMVKVSDFGTTALKQSHRSPKTLMIGSDKGMGLTLWDGKKWGEVERIPNVEHRVYEIVEKENGDIWAGFTTVSRLQFPNGFNSPPVVTTFDSTQGFTDDHGDYDLWMHEGKLYFGTARGLFSIDEKTQKLVPDATFGERFADKGHAAHYMVQDLLGQIWLYDGTRTGFLRKDQTGQWQWNDLPLRRMEDQEVWCIYPSPDSLIWIGTTTTLYCYDPRIPKDYQVPYHTLIDRVTVNDTSIVFYGNYADASGLLTDIQPDNYKLTFPFERNNIAFSYTATSYEYPEKTVFSHWLEGLEEGWSPWGPQSDKAYNDLPEGTYTFHARSKNLYDTLGKEAAYTFTILPPWYRTWWAYLGYLVLGVGLVLLIVRWQVGRANRKQEASRERERLQQRAILQATVETQESERIRIARDLHDEVGALLSTVKMSLKLSQRKLAKDGVENSLDDSTELLDTAIGSVREISHDLLPPSLESLGLCAALAQLASKTAQLSGIPFECNVSQEPPRLEIRTELTLYRIVQELISNSLKHSQAAERKLSLGYAEGQFTMRFQDNGVGFDLAKVKDSGAGLGLRGMESRVDALGGTLHLQSAPGQGFSAEISLRV